MTTTDTPTPADGTRALIAEGLAATGLLPTYERVRHLDVRLRAEVERLMPIVQEQADQLYRGDTAWHRRQRLLTSARRVLGEGLGVGLVSAARQVHELAQHCQWLAEYTDAPYLAAHDTTDPEPGSGYTGVCASCEGPITPEDVCDVHPIYGASGGGTDVYYHRECPLPQKPASAY